MRLIFCCLQSTNFAVEYINEFSTANARGLLKYDLKDRTIAWNNGYLLGYLEWFRSS